MRSLEGKRVVVTGGTGSMGNALVEYLLTGAMGAVAKIIVFSRDEAKQHAMRVKFLAVATNPTDEVIYQNCQRLLEFRIGDIRDYHSTSAVLSHADVVFHTAALKQVPTCEYFPFEAVQTNLVGTENIVRAIREHRLPVDTVVGISTDKACKPINVMGMTKAIQERMLVRANLDCPETRFVCVRYGNVLASRGSVIPLFQEQIQRGGPVTVTVPGMTRFLMTLDQAVMTIVTAYRLGRAGEILVPRIQSAAIEDLVKTLIGDRSIPIIATGIRPGEKLHEILISEEEVFRTGIRGDYFVIQPVLPELQPAEGDCLSCPGEYSSAEQRMTVAEVNRLLSAVAS